MNVLVTGAGGQLGRDLAPRLASSGFSVRALTSSDLSILDKSGLESAMEELAPGVIINCAAYTKVDLAETEKERAFEVNSTGPANLGSIAAEKGAAVIHISTDFVFDGKRPSPYREEDPARPLGEYGRSKLAGELEIRKATNRHMIVRTSWLYGSGGGGNFVKTMLKLASEREHLRVVYDQTGSPTWTGDLADALVRMTERITAGEDGEDLPYGTYHFSNEGVASWYDLAVSAIDDARALGVELKCRTVEPIRTEEYPTPAMRPSYSVLDKAKVKKTFGLVIPHWRGSLKKMIEEFFSEEG